MTAVVNASSQPMAVLNAAGQCLAANPVFWTAAGYDGSVDADTIIALPDDASDVPLVPPSGSEGLRLVSLQPQLLAPSPDEGLLARLLNALPVMVSAKDSEGRYLFVNACHAAHYGVEPATAIGRDTRDIAGEQYARYVTDLDLSVLRSGCPTGFLEENVAGADGAIRNWLINKLPLPDDQGGVAGVATLAVDMTAAREREEALIQARDRAEEAGRTRSRYLATVGHELRTPLHSIVGFSEFLAQETLGPMGNPTYREYAYDILTAGRHLLDVVNDILDMARLEVGRLPLDEQPLDLCRSAGDVVRLLALPAKHKGTAIRLTCQEGMPVIIADPRRIRQVILNLLNNAINYTPPGGEIVTSIGLESNGDVVLEVADNGLGIAPDDLPTALAPFGRLPQALETGATGTGPIGTGQADTGQAGMRQAGMRQEGVGLGLPLVKALTEAHGGRFELLSTPGDGTRARVILPRYRLRP